jgi:hypothetical protein
MEGHQNKEINTSMECIDVWLNQDELIIIFEFFQNGENSYLEVFSLKDFKNLSSLDLAERFHNWSEKLRGLKCLS